MLQFDWIHTYWMQSIIHLMYKLFPILFSDHIPHLWSAPLYGLLCLWVLTGCLGSQCGVKTALEVFHLSKKDISGKTQPSLEWLPTKIQDIVPPSKNKEQCNPIVFTNSPKHSQFTDMLIKSRRKWHACLCIIQQHASVQFLDKWTHLTQTGGSVTISADMTLTL